MFSFIKEKLQKIYSALTTQLSALFGQVHVDEQTLKDLEIVLLSADTGVKTTRSIIQKLREDMRKGSLSNGAQLKTALKQELTTILQSTPMHAKNARIHILVGINGSGKTTFAGKLVHDLAQKGNKVLLVAADTFRAAAPEQLNLWAKRSNADIVLGTPNQDPAAVVFKACQQFNDGSYDALVIDTAGRLHTKVNLMNELAKIKKVISKQLPDQEVNTLLTIDAMLGQNSFEQATLFKECTDVNGIVLTKMDGTGKGGIIFAIAQELAIPITYISYGEKIDDLKPFDIMQYVDELIV